MGKYYPASWAEYIGQDRARKQLRMMAESARVRREPADHVLLEGGRGGGKTALALLFAREAGRNVRMVSGAVRMQDARMMLWDMHDGDVLFYDEIHKVTEGGKKNAEWLLHLLQDGVLMTPLGPETVPRVTIVGATTDVGRLPETITGRFRSIALTPYSDTQAAAIAQRLARPVLAGLKPPSEDNCAALAAAGNNNPRAIEKLLEALRDMVVTKAAKHGPTGYDLSALFDLLDLTPDGLDAPARTYLRVLATDFNGGPAGATTLAERLDEPGGVGHVEQVLMAKGLLARTQQGRLLTPAGVARVRELAA